MSDSEYQTSVKITTEGDTTGVENAQKALKKLENAVKAVSESLGDITKASGEQAAAAENAASRTASASKKASGEVKKFSKDCQKSVREAISSINQWITGFGAFGIASRLISEVAKIKKAQDEIREAAIKSAEEIEQAFGQAALQRVEDMAKAQQSVADAITRQAQQTRALNQARAEAEDAAHGQQLAKLDMEEQEALSQLAPDDAIGRARLAYAYGRNRRQLQYQHQEKTAARKLEDAEAAEQTAKEMLQQKQSARAAHSQEAGETLKEIEETKKLIETLKTPEFKEVTSMIGGAMVKSRVQMLPSVETLAAIAAAATRLEGLKQTFKKQAGMSKEAGEAIPQLETDVQAAGIRRQTAAGELEALRETAPKLNTALARSEYKNIVQMEEKEAAERRKREARQQALADQIAEKEREKAARQARLDKARARADDLRAAERREHADVARVQGDIGETKIRMRGRGRAATEQALAPLRADLERETEEARAATNALISATAELSKVRSEETSAIKKLAEEIKTLKSRMQTGKLDTGNID